MYGLSLIPGLDEVTGPLAIGAGILSAGLSGVSAVAYYVGGNLKDGNTSLLVAGLGFATGGMGSPAARIMLRNSAAGDGFVAKGVVTLFGRGADASHQINNVAGLHFAAPGTLFGATTILGSWNSDPGGDW